MVGKQRTRDDGAPRPADTRSAPLLPPPVPRREKQTLIPHFDPEALAKELEAEVDRPTITPPYDPSSYARIVDGHIDGKSAGLATPRTMTAATPAVGDDAIERLQESSGDAQTSGSLGRAMYGNYLQSNYPEALVLAERVLEREPDHALAQLVAEGCRERLGAAAHAPRLMPSSVVRLKRPAQEITEIAQLEYDFTSQIVLGHLDGIADVAMVADLAGIPRPEALDRLHALLELDMLEVVNS